MPAQPITTLCDQAPIVTFYIMERQSLLDEDGGGGSPLLEGPAQGGYGTTPGGGEATDNISEQMSNRSRHSTTRSITTTTQRSVKRYRLSLLIVMGLDAALVVFLSILCFLVSNYVLFIKSVNYGATFTDCIIRGSCYSLLY